MIPSNKEKVLYENSVGSNETITLNDNLSNYKSIEIYYRGADENRCNAYIKIENPNGKTISLMATQSGSDGAIYMWNREVVLSETTITSVGSRYSNSHIDATNKSNTANENKIYIMKVVGRK